MTKPKDTVIRDTRANQPSVGTGGRLYYVTDENVLERDSGVAWENVEAGPAPGGVLSAFEANLSGEHSPTNATWGKIPFSVEAYDYGGHYNPASGYYRWTPPAGLVYIYITAWLWPPSGNGVAVGIYRSGSNRAYGMCRAGGEGESCPSPIYIEETNGSYYYEAWGWRWNWGTISSDSQLTQFGGMCYSI